MEELPRPAVPVSWERLGEMLILEFLVMVPVDFSKPLLWARSEEVSRGT